MSDDLVKRLRNHRVILKSGDFDGGDVMRAWCAAAQAADEIERLRGALGKIAHGKYDGLEVDHYSAKAARDIARAALVEAPNL